MGRWTWIWSTWLVLATLVMACAAPAPAGGASARSEASSTGSQPTTKRIVAAIRGDPHTLGDAINAAGGGRVAGVQEVEQLLNSGLGLIDIQGQNRPLLAEQIPSLENGLWKLLPDGRMETTWKLRPNVVWHDGTAFTAADLVFSTRVASDKNLTIAQDVAYAFVDAAEAPDPLTFVVTWKGPFIEADTLMTRTDRSRVLPMPRHILEPAYTEDRANVLQHAYWTQEFIGTGPYKLRELVPGSHMVLRANDAFVLGRPRLDEIEVKFLWDTNVIVANVLSGAVELTLGPGLSVEQAILVREQWREGRVEAPLETLTALWPQFINPDPPVVADVRFRRAMLHALDRQQIVDTFLGGITPVAHSFVAPDQPEFAEINPYVAKYDYDPRRATELIESLGYTRGADGLFRTAGGQRLQVEVRTTAHELREKLLFVLADYWGRVGATLDPVIIPRQRAADREYRATSLSFDFRFNPPEVTRYHSSQVPLPENNYRGNNSARYRNAELDALLDRYIVTIPKQERTQLLAQITQHMTEQLVVVPLFHDAEPVLINQRVLNAGAKKGDALQGWNVQEWDVR